MRNKILPLFLMSAFLAAPAGFAKNSKKSLFGRSSTRLLPLLNVELSNQLSSNIEAQNQPKYENTISSVLKIQTTIKQKIGKKIRLIDVPTAELEYAPEMEEKRRNTKVSNVLLGLYRPRKGLIYSTSFNQIYSDSFSLDENSEILRNKYWGLNSETGVIYSFSKKLKGELSAVADFKEYSTPYTNDTEEENDQIAFTLKLRPSYKINNQVRLKASLSAGRTLFKERRALTATGLEEGIKADIVDLYTFALEPSIRLGLVSLTPKLAQIWSIDQINGGRSHTAVELGTGLSLGFGKIALKSNGSYTKKDYKTQLNYPTMPFGSTYWSETIRVEDEVSFTGLIEGLSSLSIGHTYQKVMANKLVDESDNHVYKLAIKVDL